MAKDIFDIIDTTVKIGLGASISGATAYFIARYNYLKESKREYIKRRLDILETAIEKGDTYVIRLFELISTVDSIKRLSPNLKKIENKSDFDHIKKAKMMSLFNYEVQ
jgi:uncharacterized protein Yka (UPF0111/DUF47 family)